MVALQQNNRQILVSKSLHHNLLETCMDSDPAQDMMSVSVRRMDDKCLLEMVSVPSFADEAAQETIVLYTSYRSAGAWKRQMLERSIGGREKNLQANNQIT